MIKGLVKYHLTLLIKDPILVLLGLAYPFVQLFIAQAALDRTDYFYVNLADITIISFMSIAAMVLCWGAGANHAHSREIKFLRRLRMSPVKPVHYLTSEILLNIGVLLIFTTILIVVAGATLDINIIDRNWALIVVVLLLSFAMFYVIAMFTVNVLKKAKNSQSLLYVVFIGMIVVVNLLVMDNMPNFIQVIIRNTPITYATNVMQSAWMGTELFYGHDFIAMVICIVVFGMLTIKFFKYE